MHLALFALIPLNKMQCNKMVLEFESTHIWQGRGKFVEKLKAGIA